VDEGDRGSNAGGAFRQVLGPSQPYTQWVTETLSLLVERPGREADHCFTFLTFIGPCIVIYSYSKTNQMHQFLIFIYF
jgi:hypothetical protein